MLLRHAKARRPAGPRRRAASPRAEGLEGRLLLSAGEFDAGFGRNGIAEIASLHQVPAASALQPDGKLVIAGLGGSTGGSLNHFAIARLHPDGTLDRSFGDGGEVTVSFGATGGERASAVAIQPDGKIIVAGTQRFESGGGEFAVTRLNPDGSRDASFDLDGRQSVRFHDTDSRPDVCTGVAIDPSGRIILVGSAALGTGDDRDFAVARLLPNGALDRSFAGTGTRTIPFDLNGSRPDHALSVAALPDGRLVVAGTAADSGERLRLAVARLRVDGSLDTTFGQSGRVTLRDDILDTGLVASVIPVRMAVQPGGSILVAGTIRGDGGGDMVVARLTADGRLDAGFGSSGQAVINVLQVFPGGIAPGGHDVLNEVIPQADGKILVTGTTARDDPMDRRFLALARLDANGRPDPTFGASGIRSYYGDERAGGSVALYGAPTPVPSVLRPDGLVLTTFVRADNAGGVGVYLARFTTASDPKPEPDRAPPVVVAFRPILARRGQVVTGLVLTFSEPVEGADAALTYLVIDAGRDRRFNTRDDKILRPRQVAYDPATRTVTLSGFKKKMRLKQSLALAIDAAGIRDAAGNRLLVSDGTMDIRFFGRRPRA